MNTRQQDEPANDEMTGHRTAGRGSAEHELWRSRPSLTVWSYDTPRAAAAGTLRFAELVRSESVSAIDAVTVMWVPGSHRPWIGQLRHTHHSFSSRAPGAGLVGLVRLLLGPESGDDELSRIADTLAGSGVDAEFLREARSLMAAPRSTLMVLSSGADLDVVRQVVERGLSRGDVRLLHALLRGDARELLLGALDERDHPDGPDRLDEPARLANEMTARFDDAHTDPA